MDLWVHIGVKRNLIVIDLGTHKIKDLSIGKITSEEYFMNSYVEEIYESEQVHTSTNLLCAI